MNRLVIDVGVSSRYGAGLNTGSSAVMERLSSENAAHDGVLLAVAEVVGDPGDDEPEKTVLSRFKNTFLDVPEYWATEDALKASFAVANKSVRSNVYHRHAVTLSSLVLIGNHVFIGHAGNNRVWIFRDGRLRQLTSDHTQPRVNQDSILTRACGMESDIEMEFRCDDIRKGDVLLLTNCETNNSLDGSAIISALVDELSAARMAESIANTAVKNGTQSRISVIVARIDRVADENKNIGIKRYYPPVRKLPANDSLVDDFEIHKRNRKGRLAHYYSATDTLDGSSVLLKLPDPGNMLTQELQNCFSQDEWNCRQILHPVLTKVINVNRGRRSALYTVLELTTGENLAQRAKRKGQLPVAEIRLIAGQLLGFIEHLHKQNIFHRDIRPENIVLNRKNRAIQMLGFDSQRIRYWLNQPQDKALQVLSARYLAPEIFRKHNDAVQADIYAIGVTLYYLLTGKFPYGRVKTPDNIMAKKFRPIAKYDSKIPLAIANAIDTACAFDPDQRYTAANEFMDALA